MTDKLRTALTVLAILATLWVWGNCRESAGAKRALQTQQDHVDDSTHVANDFWKAQFLSRDSARDDSLQKLHTSLRVARGEITRLRATIPPPVTPSDTARDAVIAAQAVFIQQQDSSFAAERRLYRAMLVDRDSVIAKREREITALTTARDTWKRAARGSKLGCAWGPTALASLSGRVSAGVGVTCGIRF